MMMIDGRRRPSAFRIATVVTHGSIIMIVVIIHNHSSNLLTHSFTHRPPPPPPTSRASTAAAAAATTRKGERSRKGVIFHLQHPTHSHQPRLPPLSVQLLTNQLLFLYIHAYIFFNSTAAVWLHARKREKLEIKKIRFFHVFSHFFVTNNLRSSEFLFDLFFGWPLVQVHEHNTFFCCFCSRSLVLFHGCQLPIDFFY